MIFADKRDIMTNIPDNHFDEIHLPSSSNADSRITYTDGNFMLVESLREFYNMQTHKVKFNFFLVCKAGRLQLQVNGSDICISEKQMLICPSNMVVRSVMMSPDCECSIFCITDQLLAAALKSRVELWDKTMYINKYFLLDIPRYDSPFFEYFKSKTRSGGLFREEIILSLISCMLLEVLEHIHQLSAVPSAGDKSQPSRNDELFNKFLDMLSGSKVKRNTVEWYAREMCITPKYLSSICKNVSGKAPITWINDYVMQDICVFLRDTNLTCKEISDELGFPNSSYFGKFVKDRFGISPRAYRLQLRKK